MLLAMLAVPAMAISSVRGLEPDQYLYVDTPNGGSLNVREAGNAQAKLVGQAVNGSCVVVDGAYEGYYLLVTVLGVGSKADLVGWVDMRYLSLTPPESKPTPTPAPAETVKSLNFSSFKFPAAYTYVAAKPSRAGGYVNLRWAPSTEAAVIEKMYACEEMEVITEGNTWYQVKCVDGYVGFIMKKFTEVVYYGVVPREAVGTDADTSVGAVNEIG